MPFYEYQCKSCGHALEAMQKVNDSPLKKCPHCGKSQLTRLMSAPVFRLKGGGWYETDFKGDQDNKRNLADRPEGETAKDEKKAETDAKTAEPAAKDASGKDAGGAPGTTGPAKDAGAAAPGAATPAKDAGAGGAKSAQKGAAKQADKSSGAAESHRKPAGGGMSKRGVPAKSTPKKAVARRPAKSKKRR